MDTLTVGKSPLQVIKRAHEAVKDRWCGCDWPTVFGPLKFNLDGVNSRHARILAEATSGQESLAWEAAAAWLIELERDAQTARLAAAWSLSLAESGQLVEALLQADQAVSLEAKYREPITWKPLRSLIAELTKSVADGGH